MAKQVAARSLSALDICLLYGIGASAWIILSGSLTGFLTLDAATLARVELVKGLLFVSVTTALLWVALRHTGVDVAQLSRRGGMLPSGWTLLGAIAAMMLLVPLVGYGVLRVTTPSLERATFSDLRSIAELQGKSLDVWENERRADLLSLATYPAFRENVIDLRDANDSRPARRVREYFTRLSKRYPYHSLKLVDPDWEPLAGANPINGELRSEISRQRTVPGQALYVEGASGRLRQDFIQELTSPEGELLAYLIGSTLPGEAIYREVGQLFQPYKTAETMLVRVADNRVTTQHITQIASDEAAVRVEAASRDELARLMTQNPSASGAITLQDHRETPTNG